MNIKVVVTNKIELTDGRRGPLMTPFDADIDFVIENISNGVKFKTGSKFLDIEFLEKVKLNAEKSKKDLESKSEEVAETPVKEVKTEGTNETGETPTEEIKEEEVTETPTEEIKEEETSDEEVQADGTKNKKRNRNN